MRRKTLVSEEEVLEKSSTSEEKSSFKSYFGEFPGHVESMYNVLAHHEQCSIV